MVVVLPLPSPSSLQWVPSVRSTTLTEALIPLYVSAMALEVLLSRGRHVYSLNDTITSLSAGVFAMLLAGLTVEIALVPFAALRSFLLRKNLVLLAWQVDSWPAFIVMIFCMDFGYYVAHRLAHQVSLMWAGHAAHHSSEHYNLSTALRQGGLERFFNLMVYLPLAFVADVEVFQFFASLNAAYQFWVHTQIAPTIVAAPILGKIFVTPSSHQVHHARNPSYIDVNFGGMFCIWDRWFGTYKEMSETPVYGLVTPLQTFSPVYVQFHHLWHLAVTVVHTPGLVPRLKVLFLSPSHGITEFPKVDPKAKKYDPKISRQAYWWAAITFFGFMLVPIVVFLQNAKHLALFPRFLGAAIIVAALHNVSQSLNGSQSSKSVFLCHLCVILCTALYSIVTIGLAAEIVLPVAGLSFAFAWFQLAR